MAMPRKWSLSKSWAALALAAACTVALALLAGYSILETGKGIWAAAFLLALGMIAAVTTLFATDDSLLKARRWHVLLRPRSIAAIFVAVFAAFGVVTNGLTLFEPRPAVESSAGIIERKVTQIATGMAPAAPARVRQQIVGVWGEAECSVTLKFGVRKDALIVESRRRPVGERPYRLVATIVHAQGDVMEVRGEEPAAAEGKAATFTYSTNGETERLMWDDQVDPVPSEYRRC